MNGKPLEEAKQGAKGFLATLHDRDEVSLIFFDGRVYPTFGPKKLGESRAEIVGRIDGLIADGRTALYDATAQAYELARGRAEKAPTQIHAIVVMTDGRDEGSQMSFRELTSRFAGSGEAAEVKIFTIAYGDQADPTVLAQIAEAAKGTTAKGNTATIVEVFKDIAAFF
jgi:Ca-activated chloride channel homolog